MVDQKRGGLSLLLVAVIATGSACSTVRLVSGPKWTERAEPIETTGFSEDHSERAELRFVVFGDSGTGEKEQRRVAERMLQECSARGGCDFALMTGDSVYPSGVRPIEAGAAVEFDPAFVEKFELPYAGFESIDFWAVPGNHDWYREGSVDALVRYTEVSERWRMPAHDYAVPGLPDWLRIYALDTTKIEGNRETGQIRRARAELCEGPGWRLLFGHHPVYSSGTHAGQDGTFVSIREQLLLPLIERCGIHLYFAGHDHHQELLRSPAFDQVIQGAGAKVRRLHMRPRLPANVESLLAVALYGFALVQVTADELELRFFGYDPHHSWRELFCRRYERREFGGRLSRATDCREQQHG